MPPATTSVPEQRLNKRQSLIPFPRTGKRSGSQSGNREFDQIYVYEEDEVPNVESSYESEADFDDDLQKDYDDYDLGRD